MTSMDYLKAVRQFVAAFNRHSLETLDTFYADGAVRETLLGKAQGKEAIRKSREGLFKAIPNVTLDYRHQFAVDTHGVLEWTLRGNHTRVMELPWGSFAATGKWIEITGVSVFEFDERGLIVRERVYQDIAGLLTQLGMLKIPVPA